MSKEKTEKIMCVVCEKKFDRRVKLSKGRSHGEKKKVARNRRTCSTKCARIARKNADKYYGKKNYSRIKKRVEQREFSKTEEGRKWKARQSAKRREFMRAVKHSFTKKQWDAKLRRSKGICKKCEKNVGIKKLTLDHRFPISKAYKRFLRTGKKTIYTIRKVDAICRECNCEKKNK